MKKGWIILKRIIDANLNRASEAARILEEISRFMLDDRDLSEKLKNIRHKLSSLQDEGYENYLRSRDVENDVGLTIENPTQRADLENIFKANIKRLQQSLRTLAEYSLEKPENLGIYEKLRYSSYNLEKIMWEKLKERYNQFKLSEKRLYLVTNSDNFSNSDDFLDAVASALEGGVDIIQLREKNMSASQIMVLGGKIKQLCALYGAIFIINDRVDIALALEADGVHLGQDDMDVHSARKILGNDFIIGVSTHAPEQAQKAVSDGADYIGVGPVFETPTKAGRKAVGLDYAAWVSKNISIPAFAIGGINLENCESVLDTGISRLAVVRAIINSPSPEKSAKEFLNKLDKKAVVQAG